MTHLSLKVANILHQPREISAYSLDLAPKSSFPENMQVPREGTPLYLLCGFVLSMWRIPSSTWHIVVIYTYLLKRPITHSLSDLQLACFPLQALVFRLEIKMTAAPFQVCPEARHSEHKCILWVKKQYASVKDTHMQLVKAKISTLWPFIKNKSLLTSNIEQYLGLSIYHMGWWMNGYTCPVRRRQPSLGLFPST